MKALYIEWCVVHLIDLKNIQIKHLHCKIFPTVCLSHFDNGLMRMLISGGTRPPKKGVLSEWTLPPEPVTCIIDILACLIAANSVYHIWNCCDKSMDKVNRKICRHNVLQRKVTAKKESRSAASCTGSKQRG